MFHLDLDALNAGEYDEQILARARFGRREILFLWTDRSVLMVPTVRNDATGRYERVLPPVNIFPDELHKLDGAIVAVRKALDGAR